MNPPNRPPEVDRPSILACLFRKEEDPNNPSTTTKVTNVAGTALEYIVYLAIISTACFGLGAFSHLFVTTGLSAAQLGLVVMIPVTIAWLTFGMVDKLLESIAPNMNKKVKIILEALAFIIPLIFAFAIPMYLFNLSIFMLLKTVAVPAIAILVLVSISLLALLAKAACKTAQGHGNSFKDNLKEALRLPTEDTQKAS